MTPTAVAAPPAQPAVVPALPFTASAHEHTEPAFTVTATPGAAEQALNPIDIPASGYLRHIFLEVSCTGGVGGTLAADGPWNLLSNVTLQDVNGTNVVNLSGYNLYIANVIGGYAFRNNPAEAPFFVGSAPNPVFFLRVPVEVSAKDGLGALPNQNSSANMRLLINIAARNVATSVDFTTAPLVTIRGWYEGWTIPAETDGRGRPQAQVPPLVGTGQYWSSQRPSTLAGDNTVPIRKVGNLIRAIAFVSRDASGVRQDTVFPDPARLEWEGNVIHSASQRYWQQYLFEKLYGFTRPTGVYAFLFNYGGAGEGKAGNEDPNLWLPTAQSSRLELRGVSAVAGSIDILVNEIAPIEVNQAERYVVPNDSSFRPAA